MSGRAGCLQGERFWFLPRVRWASPVHHWSLKKQRGPSAELHFTQGRQVNEGGKAVSLDLQYFSARARSGCLPDQPGQAWSVWTWFRADPWQGLLWAWVLGMVVGRQWLLWQGFLRVSPGSRKKDYTTEWGPKHSTPSSPMKRRNSPASPKATVAPRVLFYPLPLPPTEWPLILNGTVIFPVS